MGRPRWNILLQKRTAEKQKLCSKRSREDGSINDLSTQRRNVFFELDGKIKTLNEMGTVPSCAMELLRTGTHGLDKIKEICAKYNYPTPTEIKMIYDVKTKKFNVAYQYKEICSAKTVADGLFCREIDGLFCRSSPDIIVRRRCVLSHKRRGWLQPSPSFRYSRNLALQDELYHPVINNGPAVLVCVDKRLGTGPVNQSRDAG